MIRITVWPTQLINITVYRDDKKIVHEQCHKLNLS